MDLTTITDINELKALAYDQLALLEQTQRNIANLNQRINEVKKMGLSLKTPAPPNRASRRAKSQQPVALKPE